MKVCTFAGHSLVCSEDMEQRLYEEIDSYLSGNDEVLFYVGGRDEFDSMAITAVQAVKQRHKDKKIQLYLVEPYMRAEINRNKDH